MNIIIYLFIIVLFLVLFFWIWNNTKDYENMQSRIIYIIAGVIAISIATFILYSISSWGIKYENKEILKQIRKIALLIFIPINGYITLPHIASIKTEITSKKDDNEKIKNKIMFLGIIIIIAIVFEIIYLKNFQNGIIQIINSK